MLPHASLLSLHLSLIEDDHSPKIPSSVSTTTILSDIIFLWMPALKAEPEPGRIPKVYNALITSNQNLEPSKAYPVYQPVLHDAFAFPFQPVFYGGGFPFGAFPPAPALIPREPTQKTPAEAPQTETDSKENATSTESASSSPEPSNEVTKDDNNSASSPPPPPATQSPIPLNEFGLPAQVYPLSHFDPAYAGINQIGPFSYHGFYSYPSVRFYDPYDPFSLNLYPSTPLAYGPLSNVLGYGIPVAAGKDIERASPEVSTPVPAVPNKQTPPSEPSNLNILNYSSSDSNIPNVPPPPLLPGGLKPDKKE